jgi:hypothetical protein
MYPSPSIIPLPTICPKLVLANNSGRLRVENEPFNDSELFPFFVCVTYLVDTIQSTFDVIIMDATFADHVAVCGTTAIRSSRFICILMYKEEFIYLMNIVNYFLTWFNLINSIISL